MHVLQYIATTAESTKEAFNNVKDHLEEVAHSNFWSDWHVVGGGRWSQNSKDGYNDTMQDVISYVKDKDKFTKAIQWSKKARADEMKQLLSQLQKDGGEATFIISALEYIKTAKCDSISMNAYYVNRISQMLLGHWTSDSYFFDISSNSSSYEYIEEAIEENPDNVYLVPVDFHF
jgi:hypothetical protein